MGLAEFAEEGTASGMAPVSRLHLLLVGADHITCPIGVREALARRLTYRRLRHVGGTRPPWDDLLLLTTCNRVEAYAATRSAVRASRAICQAFRLKGDSPYLYALEDEAAAEHLLRVASGFESMAQGEGQVGTQVRRAALARPNSWDKESGLASLFAHAARAARRIRADAGLADGGASASATAVRFIQQAIPIPNPDVVLIGTGKMARLAVDRLAGKGSLTLLGRNPRKARGVGTSTGGESGGLNRLGEALARADVAIAATSGRKPLITSRGLRPAIAKRSGRPLWLIDLGFPRNIDPGCGLLEGVTLVDLDGLAPWGWQPLPPSARAQAESRIREETGRLLRLLTPGPEPDVARFRKAVERARRDEVDRAFGRLPRLSPEERLVIDKLASRLVNRFLHAPTEWLRTLPEELAGPTVAELVHRLRSPEGR